MKIDWDEIKQESYQTYWRWRQLGAMEHEALRKTLDEMSATVRNLT